jgi:H+/Cl- antiporter ClcA
MKNIMAAMEFAECMQFQIRSVRKIEQVALLPQLIKWFLISLAVAGLAGTAIAGFDLVLDWLSTWRETHLWIIALLPLCGFFAGWIYHVYGKSVERGSDLLIDEIHTPSIQIPLRMATLILLGTWLTHLFGGSAGREGTAVQLGGALADRLTKPLRLKPNERPILLMAGMSAGFAAVFGTPLAGAVFGLEVLALGGLRYNAIFPCFVAALAADQVTRAWGVTHETYQIALIPHMTFSNLVYAIFAGAVFGIVGMLFAKTHHMITHVFRTKIFYAPLRPFVGGIIVATAVWILGTTRYIGLGLETISESFSGHVGPFDFMAKLLFTAMTLGSGFKGGEVTPLFFIGSTLGNTLSSILPLPSALLAGMGFVGVFAGAGNVPLACTILALEVFGPQVGVYAGVACVASFVFSGHAGIYSSQRPGFNKGEWTKSGSL